MSNARHNYFQQKAPQHKQRRKQRKRQNRVVQNAISQFSIGERVTVQGLQNAPQFNGIQGTILSPGRAGGSWKVKLDNGSVGAFFSKNLQGAFAVPQGFAKPRLPAGWTQAVDPGTGRTYYMNHQTKATQWDMPVAAPPPMMGAPPPPAQGHMQYGQDSRQATFQKFDKDGSGSIDVNELGQALASLRGVYVNPQEVQGILTWAKGQGGANPYYNGGNTLDFNGFCKVLDAEQSMRKQPAPAMPACYG